MTVFNLFKKKMNAIKLSSCTNGMVVDIMDVADPVFSGGLLGGGVGIRATSNLIVSPIAGEIVMIFPTKHAIGIKSKENVEVLIHIGINTVELNGTPFALRVRAGDKIKQGQPLVQVDFESIASSGYDPMVMMIVTNTKEYSQMKTYTGTKNVHETVILVEKE